MKPQRRQDHQLSDPRLLACVVFAALLLMMILKLSAIAGVITKDDAMEFLNSDAVPARAHTTEAFSAIPTPTWHAGECFNTLLHSKKLVGDCRQGDQSGAPVYLPYCKAILNRSQSVAQAHGDESLVSPVCGQFGTGTFSPAIQVLSQEHWNPLKDHMKAKEGCFDDLLFRTAINRSQQAHLRFTDLDRKPSGVAESKLLRVSSCTTPTSDGEGDRGTFSYFTPTELVTILHRASIGKNGRGILFTGDSMMRQLMLRIVFFIRRERHFSEHYFHQDGLYILRERGDALTVLDGAGKAATASLLHQFYPGYLTEGNSNIRKDQDHPDGDVLLALMFQWETKPSVFRSDFRRMSSIPLHIAAFMYWWQNKDPLTDIEQYMRAVEQHVQSEEPTFAAAKQTKDYIFVTTPWTSPKLFGGVEPQVRIARNEKISKWVNDRRGAAEELTNSANGVAPITPTTRWSLLDFSSIAEVEHMPKTKDGIHYMCIWTPKYHEVVTHQKYNYNGCRDPMGLAVVQWLAHIVVTGQH
ncbi:GPI-anchored surface protein, putative [Bodo saltans]|uniref:GPI-anchored surface protein, putative n=1 Tax=Bodo saltans TaxID=75058 RepID=A0A0S4JWG5_BODSA|nr:GPI-anchored surface protein, putative [Bodo saltans]|eukprot:CUG93484.1 GPI-anchored surface protein, putative [Bodo saltans]